MVILMRTNFVLSFCSLKSVHDGVAFCVCFFFNFSNYTIYNFNLKLVFMHQIEGVNGVY